MKTLYGFGSIFMILILLIKCTEDKVGTRDWPRLNTLPVTHISRLGAQYNAEIINKGDFEILRYGFVWSEALNPTVEFSDRVIFQDSPAENPFSAKIESNLDFSRYQVRSFIETPDYTIYGEAVEFLSAGSSAPNIISFSPLSGTVGDTVSIVGQRFSYIPERNRVEFANLNGPIYGSTNKADVISASDTLLVVKVPTVQYETHVKINVTLYYWTATSKDSFRYGSSKY